jgi:sulfite reductase (NADPH) hemoprotein beta-component
MAQFKNPQILFASDLRDGEVLFLGASGWTRDHREASVAQDGARAQELEARGKADVAANRVVDVYLADVSVGADGTPEPLHYREKMRIKGPSIRRDLGKQAITDSAGEPR